MLTPFQPPAGSYAYSGRHDQGVLLPPRGPHGDMAHLVAALAQAKQASNEYLTQIIAQEKEAAKSPTAEPSQKRSKTTEE